jgi:hypothetical protein
LSYYDALKGVSRIYCVGVRERNVIYRMMIATLNTHFDRLREIVRHFKCWKVMTAYV